MLGKVWSEGMFHIETHLWCIFFTKRLFSGEKIFENIFVFEKKF